MGSQTKRLRRRERTIADDVAEATAMLRNKKWTHGALILRNGREAPDVLLLGSALRSARRPVQLLLDATDAVREQAAALAEQEDDD
jgi:hypothetical protein